ncbi:peptide ABC transporter substrate-binding protein [Vallitalea okinawensis]|uniref:peptide ABC transporter substrate-binding protein n=1 Tax=Vallitalea okinawensis TaxID=2078660 RepID=UPI000CFDDA91|nr:peptide ABC transporter substrate-binding protein [Vallitalea okinawensis]
MKRKMLALISVLLVLSLFTGCFSDTTSGGNKVLRIVSGGEPGSLHPSLAQGTHESIILDHIFEGLMRRDENGNLVEGVAESYAVSEDKLTYTFTIRKDAKWSNGDSVTAEDFEYAWKHALNPLTASDYSYQLYYMVGATEFNTYDLEKGSEEELKKLEDAVGVRALDERTLEVNLAQPTPFFLELCGFYTYYPIPKSVQEENPDWANDGSTHISNGPFEIVEWNHDESVVTSKNKKYYNKDKIKLDGIEFTILEDQNTEWQMYQSGELDINNNLPPDVLGTLRAENNPELIIAGDLATYFYRFNTTLQPFNNMKVRKALSMAIDREIIVEEVAQGGQIPAFGIVPFEIPDGNGDFREIGGDYFSEDLEEAKKLLAEGLAEEGMDSLNFTLLYNTQESHQKIAEAIQEMWRQLGVEITLENTEFRVKIEREHALDYEVARAGWIGDYVDPNTFLDMFTSWSTQNDTGWTNDEFDKFIEMAGNEFDANKRMEYLHEAEAILMEELPIMPIYYYTRPRCEKPYVKDTFKVINREVCLIYADIEDVEE